MADDVVNPFGGAGASGNGSSTGDPADWATIAWLPRLRGRALLIKDHSAPGERCKGMLRGGGGRWADRFQSRRPSARWRDLVCRHTEWSPPGGKRAYPGVCRQRFSKRTGCRQGARPGGKGRVSRAPLLYGLAADGEQGATAVLGLIATKLERVMTLGLTSLRP